MPEIENREWQKTGSVRAVNLESRIGNRKNAHIGDVQSSKFKVQSCKKNTGRLYRWFLNFNIEHRTSNAEQPSMGFTSVELVIVIIALSILTAAAVVSFRFTDQDKSTIAADQLIADIQYVQMRAMGVGNSQRIQFAYTSNLSDYRILDNANIPIESKNLPDSITVNSNNFGNILSFNSMGEPFYGSNNSCTGTTSGLPGNCSITLRDNVTIMIYAITGKTCRYDVANSRCF